MTPFMQGFRLGMFQSAAVLGLLLSLLFGCAGRIGWCAAFAIPAALGFVGVCRFENDGRRSK